MQTKNSLVVYNDMFAVMIEDAAALFGYMHYARDQAYARSRVETEGIAFLTRTLPLVGKALDASLSTGNPFRFLGLKQAKGRTTPKFLGWLFERIFDETGMVLSNAEPEAVKTLRQLLFVFYKLELPYDETLKNKILDAFVTVDNELLSGFDPESISPVMERARQLITAVCAPLALEDFLPKHGPGSVATGEKQWQKMHFKRIYASLEEFFPFTEWFFASAGHLCDSIDALPDVSLQSCGVAKVVLVPKDSRGPRLISAEPLEFQWIQQGIARALMKRIDSCFLTKGRVNFVDQTINGKLALVGSKDGSWGTLDMKDASDRVSTALVENLFADTHVLPWLLASRSTSTKMPNGKIVTLNKFAPMGSALCFPVESLIFWALSVASIQVLNKVKPKAALKRVFVYGDDLVIRTEDCGTVMQTLPKVGLMFNSGKCCIGGSFRESCGVDAFKGIDVTPVKIRSTWSSSPNRTNQLLAYVEYSNELYARGYWGVSSLIMELIASVFKIAIPSVSDDRPRSFICYRRAIEDMPRSLFPRRWKKRYQHVEIRAYTAHSPLYPKRVSSWQQLFWFLARASEEVELCRRTLRQTPKEFALSFRSNEPLNVRTFPFRGRVTHIPRWCALGA